MVPALPAAPVGCGVSGAGKAGPDPGPDVVATIAEARAWLARARADGRRVALVPTMGALHAGHRSLLERARADCDAVVLSIFVNPLQFGPDEDLATYPRALGPDLDAAAGGGASLVFAPDAAEMYPRPPATTIVVEELSRRLEGVARPAHLAGVATVVATLFNIVGPCRAYFGEKDYQQLVVVRRLASDLSFPVDVVGCPTVREPDGLALSSRNRYLGPAERAAAPVLHRALAEGAATVDGGERDAARVREVLRSRISSEPLARLDYAEVLDAATLEAVDPLVGELRLLAAARFGPARLIDNVGATVPRC